MTRAQARDAAADAVAPREHVCTPLRAAPEDRGVVYDAGEWARILDELDRLPYHARSGWCAERGVTPAQVSRWRRVLDRQLPRGRPHLALRLVARPSWFDHAACASEDTDLFYGPFGERPEARERRERAARAICARCPVAAPCRAWAREHGEHGVWGGETVEDRIRAGHKPESIDWPTVKRAREVVVPMR